MKRTLLTCLLLLGGTCMLMAQGIGFAQPSGAALYYNPGFTGASADTRITAAYRNDWTSIPGAPNSGYLSYDQVSNKLRGGIGIEARNTTIGERYHDAALSFMYAGKIPLGPRWTLSPALKVGIGFNNDERQLANTGQIGGTSKLNRFGLVFMPGLLLNTHNFYVGFSVDNLLCKPIREYRNQASVSIGAPARAIFQAGYNFSPQPASPWSVSLSSLVRLQQNFTAMQFQSMFRYKPLLVGGGVSINNYWDVDQFDHQDIFVSLGFKTKRMRVMGSYSFALIQDGQVNTNSAEISATFYLPRKLKTVALAALK